MGMYTEFTLIAPVKADAKEAAAELLRLRADPGLDDPPAAWAGRSEPFFALPRSDLILTCGGCNGWPAPAFDIVDDEIRVATELKNYAGEIQAFLEMLTPVIDLARLQGEVWYEEWDSVAALMADNAKIIIDYSGIHRPGGRGRVVVNGRACGEMLEDV